MKDVLAAIEYDQVLTSRLLRASNAASYASAVKVTTVRDAVVRLGMGRVVALAIGSSVRGQMQAAVPEYGLTEGQLWRHSVAAALAAEIAPSVCAAQVPVESFPAALLHDFGKLVLARFLDPDLLTFLARARVEGGLRDMQAETEILGVHHGELAGVIAQRWDLPEAIVIGVTHHHAPGNANHPVADVVHLADCAAKAVGAGLGEPASDALVSEGTEARLGIVPGGFDKLCERVGDRLEDILARYE